MISRAVLAAAVLSLLPVGQGTASATVAPGCTAAAPTFVGGTIRGYPDNRFVDTHIGILILDGSNRHINPDGSPNTSGGYSWIEMLNHNVAATGTTDGTTERGVSVHTRFTCYEIHGSTLAQLNAQMAKLGPKVDTSSGHAAATKWRIIWSDSTLASTTQCKITSVNVRLSIVFEFPHWQQPAGISPAVSQPYDSFLNDVRTHEYTHRKIAISGADELQKALSRISPKPTCNELTKITNSTANRVIDKSKAEQNAFDAAEAAKAGGG
jgi:predicted secreted Zn-dependent protease